MTKCTLYFLYFVLKDLAERLKCLNVRFINSYPNKSNCGNEIKCVRIGKMQILISEKSNGFKELK